MPSSFADLVFAGERIEKGLKRGKFIYVTPADTSNRRFKATRAKKKEGDAHAVTSAPTWSKPQHTPHNTYQYAQHQPSFLTRIGNPSSPAPVQQRAPAQPQRAPTQNSAPTQPRPAGSSNPSTSANPGRNFPVKKPMEFASIPMSYADMLPSLIANQMAVVSAGRFSSLFSLDGTTPTQPAPIMGVCPRTLDRTMRFILEALCEAGIICFDGGKEDTYLIHPGAAYDIKACPVVEVLLQRIMDQGRFEIGDASEGEQHVCMQSMDKSSSKPKPLVIHFTKYAATQKPRGFQPTSGKKPVPFSYRSDKAVPWKYAPQKPDGRKDEPIGDDESSAKVTNISGTSGMTRNGRIFATLDSLVQSKDTKGKAKVGMEERDKASPIHDEEIPTRRFAKGEEDFGRKKISAEVANEFLRIIQQCEFKVIEQLNKTPTRVSLLELLINLEPHRALLVKILNEAHVAKDISVEGFGGIIKNITANNYLTFADEEIPIEGRGHNRALHVFVKCLDHIVVKVLIDKGSSLNVMPKSTSDRLPFNASHLRPSSMVVRAFDGICWDVRGEIDLLIQIGPHICQITFQVMDINPAYSCLLGRPWIHSIRVVPSTLHQRLKFMVEGQLIIVSEEEDILVSYPSSTPYVEAAEESLEISFQALEVVSNAYVESLLVQPRSSSAALMVARVMLRHGYEPGRGLGWNGDGATSLVEFKENRGRFELGYKPTHADIRKSTLKRRDRSMRPQQEPQVEGTSLCHII
ncbi:uncharacterized protein LOC114391605 [Glycine soja]|uniref:uncharacterized protein LOC114391605 n=1 Tax=Glycine soja TaxID=3848 RepID=UPI00103B0FBC|nr:uncharacterized protein LOC114391605 [Glycine soja]